MTGASLPRRRRRHTSSCPARQHHVEHHDVHRVLADDVQRRLPRFGGLHAIAEAVQSQLQALPGTRIVLDKQHLRHRPPLSMSPLLTAALQAARLTHSLYIHLPDGAVGTRQGCARAVTTVSQAHRLTGQRVTDQQVEEFGVGQAGGSATFWALASAR